MKVKVKTAKRQNNKNLNKTQNTERHTGRRGSATRKRAGERQTLIRRAKQTGGCRKGRNGGLSPGKTSSSRVPLRSPLPRDTAKRTRRRRGMQRKNENNTRGWQWAVGGREAGGRGAQVRCRVECTPRQSETVAAAACSRRLSLRMREAPSEKGGGGGGM